MTMKVVMTTVHSQRNARRTFKYQQKSKIITPDQCRTMTNGNGKKSHANAQAGAHGNLYRSRDLFHKMLYSYLLELFFNFITICNPSAQVLPFLSISYSPPS